jgi:hypothetical protein
MYQEKLASEIPVTETTPLQKDEFVLRAVSLRVYVVSFIIPAANEISHRSTVGSAADS